jgi:exopolysaccharide biosynthesis polyprenyl glycosylphosphotransferase
MVRLFSAYFPKRTVFLAVSETLLMFSVLLAAIFIDPAAKSGLPLVDGREFLQLTLVGLICLICLYYQNLYTPRFTTDFDFMLTRVIRGLASAAIVLAVIYLLFPAIQPRSGPATIGILLFGACLALSRHIFVALNESDRWSTPTLVIGDGPLATYIIEAIQNRPELGLKLIGYLGDRSHPVSTCADVHCLGEVTDLDRLASQMAMERVIVAMQDSRARLPIEALLDLKRAGVKIQEGAEFYELTTGRIPVSIVRPSWLLFGPGFRISKLQSFYKRVFSFTVALVASVVLLPVMAVIALAIWMDSPGSALFRQLRLGKGGRPFMLYKFRTMYNEADCGKDPLPVQPNDERVTRVGRWLRQFRLDEIPQLYNILVGHMSLVGPRPFVPNQELELAQQIPLYKQRWAVRPGATGWAQVQRGYCATVDDNVEKLAYDLFYIKNMSIGFDLLILFKTFKIVFAGIGGR